MAKKNGKSLFGGKKASPFGAGGKRKKSSTKTATGKRKKGVQGGSYGSRRG